jgi:hypothetical protein
MGFFKEWHIYLSWSDSYRRLRVTDGGSV